MKTIQEIYQECQIMPNLQTHMFRVTVVAQIICEHFEPEMLENEQGAIAAACLFHDTGNILKFDLEKFPQFLEPEGLEYWQTVKANFTQKFGADEHLASQEIARQFHQSNRVIQLIKSVSFNSMPETVEELDFGKMICEYADDRVTPFGVTSLTERLVDFEKRYGAKYPSPQEKARRSEFARLAYQLEEKIFQHCSISPNDVTDDVVNPRIEGLKNFEII
jgi:hypothetical protein